MKHVTGAVHPPSGRIYFVGGDYRSKGNRVSQSYVQEGWSLDLRARAAARNDPSAGWQEAWPYCGANGGVQPKHPDYVGWVWDAQRKVFWFVPGTMVHLGAGQAPCANETAGSKDDPAYKHNHLMTFDPATSKWTDLGTNVGPHWQDTWMSVLDPDKDRLIRFGWSGGSGAVYNVLSLTTLTWTAGGLAPNALGKDVRLFKEYLAADLQGRAIYAIDGTAGRLHRFSLDTLVLEDLGPVPGGPIRIGSVPVSNYAYPVWDSAARRLIWLRGAVNVYDPATKAWEAIPAVTVPPGLPVEARTVVYDSVNNVTLFMGGVETPNPYLFLFRYAPGEGGPSPPAPTPAPPRPSAPSR